jgi:hypothetical protein
LRDRGLLRARQCHDAGEARHVREQLRRGGDQRLGIVARASSWRRSSLERRIVFDRGACLEQ